jgi:hypothetical protein
MRYITLERSAFGESVLDKLIIFGINGVWESDCGKSKLKTIKS